MTEQSPEFSELFAIFKEWILTHAESFSDAKRLIEKDVFLIDELLWTDWVTRTQAAKMKLFLPELKKALYPAVKNSFNG